MRRFVVDCSVTMGWCFGNQADEYTYAVLDELRVSEALVPAIWPLEVANVLVVAERRRLLSRTDASAFVALLSELRITVDEEAPRRALSSIRFLALEQKLSAYDAAYLELALRQRLPFATRDKSLKRAAQSLGISLVS